MILECIQNSLKTDKIVHISSIIDSNGCKNVNSQKDAEVWKNNCSNSINHLHFGWTFVSSKQVLLCFA